MTNEPHFVVGPCQNCNGHIEFDASDFAKGETRQAMCPHCGRETVLSITLCHTKSASAKPPSVLSQRGLFKRIKVTNRELAIFFASTTFILASVLSWEHLPLFAPQSKPHAGHQSVSENQVASARKISGSDTIAVKWGDSVNRVRLDEVTFESTTLNVENGGFYVRLKNTGRLLGVADGKDADKIRAYLHGN